MIGPGILHAALAMEKRTPLLQMTPDELVRTYVSTGSTLIPTLFLLFVSQGSCAGKHRG